MQDVEQGEGGKICEKVGWKEEDEVKDVEWGEKNWDRRKIYDSGWKTLAKT